MVFVIGDAWRRGATLQEPIWCNLDPGNKCRDDTDGSVDLQASRSGIGWIRRSRNPPVAAAFVSTAAAHYAFANAPYMLRFLNRRQRFVGWIRRSRNPPARQLSSRDLFTGPIVRQEQGNWFLLSAMLGDESQPSRSRSVATWIPAINAGTTLVDLLICRPLAVA